MAAVSFEGHPEPAYDGVYKHDSTHEGWPVLKNDSGRYCYRSVKDEAWLLRAEFTPDGDACNAAIVAKEGPLPVGAHTWQVWDGSWQERTLTVEGCTLEGCTLVSPPLPSCPIARAERALPTRLRDGENA